MLCCALTIPAYVHGRFQGYKPYSLSLIRKGVYKRMHQCKYIIFIFPNLIYFSIFQD